MCEDTLARSRATLRPAEHAGGEAGGGDGELGMGQEGGGGGRTQEGGGGEVVEMEGDGARRRAELIPSRAMPDACKLAYRNVADLVTQLCERSLVIQQTSEVRR